MQTYFKISALCILGVVVPSVALASPVLRSGEEVTVSEAQAVEGNFYAAGGAVTISGSVEGDLYAASGTVTINGEVADDVVVAAGTTQIHGEVGDDVRVLAGEVTIAGSVGGDLLVLGGIVRVLSTAQIDGDVLFFGGESDLDGDVRGGVSGRAEAVRINGPIRGDVSVVTTRALQLGDQAHVGGDIEYWSVRDAVRAPGSVVVGDMTKHVSIEGAQEDGISMLPILMLFFTTLVYLTLFKGALVPFMHRSVARFGVYSLIGLGVVLGVPVAAVLLMVSVIGMPVGAALFLLWGIVLLVSWSLGGLFLGAVLARYLEGEVSLSLKWALLGTLVFALLSYMPYLGPLVVVVVALILIGSMAAYGYAHLRTR